MTEDTPRFLEHLLINGELDVAIMVAMRSASPRRWWSETLTRSPQPGLAGCQPSTDRAPREITLAECAGREQIVLEADRIDDLMTGVWSRHQLKPRRDAAHLVAGGGAFAGGRGAGIAVLPDFLYRPWTLDAEHVEVRAPARRGTQIDVGLVWRRGSGQACGGAEFIELAREQSAGCGAA